MMLTDLAVKPGPQFYRYHIGAIDYVSDVLRDFKAKNILIVHGDVSFKKAKPKLSFLKNDEFTYFYHQYGGECSYNGIEKVIEQIELHDIDFIIGVGGGKLVDLVGVSAYKANVNFGVIPTLASNCAPWTALSVMYKDSGESEGILEYYYRQAAFFITDPELVIDAPVEFFIAGLADTIAKWYETITILEQDSLNQEPFLNIAKHISTLCKDEIMANSSKAIEDMKNKRVTDEFLRLSEIVFAIAGMVGGFGDKYARSAAAHAIHDAVSQCIPKSHTYLHGEKVAYGILYQLALEKNWTQIDDLLPFYSELGLPLSLTTMSLMPTDIKVINDIVEIIYSMDEVHLLPIEVTKEKLKQAIYDLEDYINK